MSFASRIAIALLCLGSLSAGAAHATEPELSPQEIIERVGDKYSSLRTYRDEITVKGRFITGLVRARIAMAFVAPDVIFVDVRASTGYRVVGVHDGKRVRHWSSKTGWEEELSLGALLDGSLKGMNIPMGGGAYWIVSLLFPEDTSGYSLSKLTKLRRLEDAKIGRTPCYHLEGEFDEKVDLWIGSADFLIRRIEVSGLEVSADIDYTPAPDALLTVADIEKLGKSVTGQ